MQRHADEKAVEFKQGSCPITNEGNQVERLCEKSHTSHREREISPKRRLYEDRKKKNSLYSTIARHRKMKGDQFYKKRGGG